MIVKRSLIILSIILLVAMLAACVRSASTPVTNLVPTFTSESSEGSTEGGSKAPSGENPAGENPAGQTPSDQTNQGQTGEGQAVPTNEVLQQLAQFVTQTAAAAQIAGGQVPGAQPGGINALGTPYPGVEGQPSTGAAGGETPANPSEGGQPSGSTESSGQTTQPGTQPGEATQAAGQPAEGQPGGVQPTQSAEQPGSQPSAPQATAAPGAQQPAAPQPTTSSPAANPPANPVVPTVTPGIPSSYTLQPGEFVYCIARRFDVNPFELLSINGLTTNSIVRGGTTLRIPQTGNKFPGERSLMSHPTTYVVESGENIYAIACKFGEVSPDMIALVNNLKAPYTLTAGQSLYIP